MSPLFNPAALEKLSKARTELLISQPFFGTLALGLTVAIVDHVGSKAIETMATDGTRLYANPSFVMETPQRFLPGIWAHEVLHCALGHHVRRMGRDPERWNIAADYAINPMVTAAGFALPSFALVDKRFIGLSAEEIYRALEQSQQGKPQQGGQPQPSQGGQSGQPQPGNGTPQGAPQPGNNGQPAGGSNQPGAGQPQPGNGSQPGNGQPQAGAQGGIGNHAGGFGEVLDAAPEHDSEARDAIAADWQARVRQAVSVARAQGAGTIPGALAGIVAAFNEPRINWRDTLRRFVDDSTSKDYSWSKPNRRFAGAPFVLPGFVPDRPSHVAIIFDTSGSCVTEAEAFAGELQAILDEGAADKMTVAYADTRVQRFDVFESGDLLTVKPQGGGGTSFRKPLGWIADNASDATAILYFTDCEVSDWGDEPAAPILWLCTGEITTARRNVARAPFGEAIILAE